MVTGIVPGPKASGAIIAITLQARPGRRHLPADAGRLSSAGHEQERPIADNRSEEGRAKNRRVELVKKP